MSLHWCSSQRNMNFILLDKYLESEQNKEYFFEDIRSELNKYIFDVKSMKGSVQIICGESNYSKFGIERLLALLNKYLKGCIGEWDLEYILTAIEFEFEDEDVKVENVIFCFSDPYLNYNITHSNISSAIAYLSDEMEALDILTSRNDKLRNGYQSIVCQIDIN